MPLNVHVGVYVVTEHDQLCQRDSFLYLSGLKWTETSEDCLLAVRWRQRRIGCPAEVFCYESSLTIAKISLQCHYNKKHPGYFLRIENPSQLYNCYKCICENQPVCNRLGTRGYSMLPVVTS